MVCQQLKPAVSGLEQTFPGKVTARNVDVTTPGARDEFKGLGFKSHGLVIRTTDGKTLWTQADHTVSMVAVTEELHQILDP
ncbi:MAG TPA: hypothetical protein VFU59_13155 [Candidatus Eisenbacteria bacterium]|jgi:hypothetical protein|nr:hypothetical protein [Candidatus Eisenbacteria bacterium]